MREENLNLQINNFDGPMDLLLELVRAKQMDIRNIDVAELASAYIKLIDSLKEVDLDLASEYLVMAATLIQLKAKMLLENPAEAKEVEQEKNKLLKHLVEYQQYKNLSITLKKKENERDQIFIKKPEDYSNFQLEIDESRLDGKSNAVNLIMSLRKMFERTNAKKLKEATIKSFNYSPTQRREEILEIFKIKKDISFEDIFSVPSLEHFSVTIITILDMVRREEIFLKQETQFGELEIKKGKQYEW